MGRSDSLLGHMVTETEEEPCLLPIIAFWLIARTAKPMDIWIISIEGLKGVKEKQETLFDLFSLWPILWPGLFKREV